MLGSKTPWRSGIKMDTTCPITYRELSISNEDFDLISERYSTFVNYFMSELNTGELDINIVFERVIMRMYNTFPDIQNRTFGFVITSHICTLMVCDRAFREREQNEMMFYNLLVDPGCISLSPNLPVPRHFYLYLQEIRDRHTPDSTYVYNCVLMRAYFDNFYSINEFGIYLPVCYPAQVEEWAKATIESLMFKGLIPRRIFL